VKVPSYQELAALRVSNAQPWFTDAWDLNLVILRSGYVGRWDDLVVVATVDDAGREIVYPVACTADAWPGEWVDPTNPSGCVYILDGHYPGGLSLGEHKGRPALRQVRPFDCVRWPATLRTVPTVEELEAVAQSSRFSAICGTHLHSCYTSRSTAEPPPDSSEGCVVSLHRHEHAGLVELVRQQGRHAGGVTVSPTFHTWSTSA